MATIKSFTDLQQSRKLAEILPPESADMYYSKYDTIHASTLYSSCDIEYFNIHEYIPCWSLAALLGVLPYPSLQKTCIGWRCDTYNKDCTECELGDTTDNPIDACYKMIIRLHELNLL